MATSTSTLHLIVEKGPKQGETLARDPGAPIRIGRVVRGNTFAIKDPAISQKHLAIDFAPSITKWTVTDLDTSNGTFVNGVNIPPSAPFPLSDGDTIKIGETTSISVKIVGGGEIGGGSKRGRDESSDLVAEVENLGRGRPKRGKSARVLKKDEILVANVEESLGLRSRRGIFARGSKKDESFDTVVDDSIDLRPKRAGLRSRAKTLKEERREFTTEKEKSIENEIVDLAVEDSVEKPKNVKRERPRKAPARTRALQAEEVNKNIKMNAESNEIEIEDKEKGNGAEVEHEREGVEKPKNGKRGRWRKAPARTQASATEVVQAEEVDERGEINAESDEIGGGDKGKTNETEVEDKGEGVEKPKNVQRKSSRKTRASSANAVQAEEVNDDEEMDAESNESGVEDEGKSAGTGVEEEKKEFDFEKMTLGEWFDSMEKYLPLAINEVAEQMIESLWEKARRFDEYVANGSNDS